jgi:hypothetical protein
MALLNTPMLKQLKQELKPKFVSSITQSGDNLTIDNFDSGAVGKFVSLYGLNDLFKSLPDTLKQFQIINRNTPGLIVQVPEDIGRFKQLNMILLDNCINSIPDSVCSLPNLKFLALVNNPQLTEIPKCIANMSKLSFLNLKGSENVEVPQEIRNKATDFGGGMFEMD